MGEAKSRCPHLLVVPYEFDKYQTISEQVCSGWRGAGSGTAGEGCICLGGILVVWKAHSTVRAAGGRGWVANQLVGSHGSGCLLWRACMLGACGGILCDALHTRATYTTPSPCCVDRCTASSCPPAAACSRCPATRRYWMSPGSVTRVTLQRGCGRAYMKPRSALPLRVSV
jgi:hypothetical protein